MTNPRTNATNGNTCLLLGHRIVESFLQLRQALLYTSQPTFSILQLCYDDVKACLCLCQGRSLECGNECMKEYVASLRQLPRTLAKVDEEPATLLKDTYNGEICVAFCLEHSITPSREFLNPATWRSETSSLEIF